MVTTQPLLFPEMIEPVKGYEEQLEDAREIIRKSVYLARQKDTESHKTKVVCCYSCGKDSNLLLCLTIEVLKEMDEMDRLQVLCAITGYETEMWKGQHYEEYVLNLLKKQGLNVRIHRPPRIWWYSNVVIGKGREPTSFGFINYCTGQWKIADPFSSKKDVFLIGVRCDESGSRRKKYPADYNTRPGITKFAPVKDVELKVLWEYLAKNMDSILDFKYDELAEYYKNKKRDGCWMCWARLISKDLKHKRPIPIHFETVNNIASFFVIKYFQYELRIKKKGYAKFGKKPITNMWIRQCWYCIIKALERYFKIKYWDDTQEKVIRETWNFCEFMSDKTGEETVSVNQRMFWNNKDEYQMLYPELIEYMPSRENNKRYFKILGNEDWSRELAEFKKEQLEKEKQAKAKKGKK